jgi:hypothetical protein
VYNIARQLLGWKTSTSKLVKDKNGKKHQPTGEAGRSLERTLL